MDRGIRGDITGVILVGGKSRRMGMDKAFLEFSGEPLFERVLEIYRERFHRSGFEPLFALYGTKCLDPMRRLLESGNYCIYDFYPQVRIRYVPSEELAQVDKEGTSFLNINTPEEFARLEKRSTS